MSDTAYVPPALEAALRRAWGRAWRAESEREATRPDLDTRAYLTDLTAQLRQSAESTDPHVLADTGRLLLRAGAELLASVGEEARC